MSISIYHSNGALIADVNKVLSCDTQETLEGVKTLNFEILLTDSLALELSGTDEYVIYNEDMYDVVSVAKSLSRGIYKAKISCEHVSYRLNDTELDRFTYIGTGKDILRELLKDSEFSVGVVESTKAITFSYEEQATLRNLVLKVADRLNMDISFDRFTISLFTHRGSLTPVRLIDNNVVSISKTVKTTRTKPSYSITVYNSNNIVLGDELSLKFTKLGIDEDVRLVGIKAKPFTSKNIDLEIGESESTVEVDTVKTAEENVTKNTSYYGVKITEDNGLTVDEANGKAKVILNADSFRMQAIDDSDGQLKDRIYFDTDKKEYRFVGSVEIDSGSININDNFVVDENGNAYLSGDSTIYGGKYYAGKPGETTGFSQMTSGGYDVYNGEGALKLKLGYTTKGEDYPFLQLGSSDDSVGDYGLVKKFTDGLWIGNSVPSDDQGTFEAKAGYNGIFFKFDENAAYVVKDTDMKSIYTGLAVAKFG